jgi:hypothetical protein
MVKKRKKVKKKVKEIVDELQLRRKLREQEKMMTSSQEAVTQEAVKEQPRYSEDIRIGGIEG